MEEKESKGRSKINLKRINDILNTSHKLLKIVYVLVAVLAVYVFIKIFQELSIKKILLDIFSILIPLFIGIAIAWLFNPLVKWLEKHKVKRIFGVIIVYLIILSSLGLLLGTLIPILYEEIVSFASSIPNLASELEKSMNGFINRFNNIDGINIESVQENVMLQIEKFGSDLSTSLPTILINTISGFVSGISDFVMGLIIGFFFLLSFDNIGGTLASFIPHKHKNDIDKLCNVVEKSLRNYIFGVLIDAVVILVICWITFSLIGLRAPLLFAVFCAITNVIPYFGPYIGAVPALIVGFSMSPTVGLLTLVAIVAIQFFEGNFLQEYIMSKTTKLHPVTIIIGLLIFGHYWGIVGMVISTPLIAILKQLYIFFDERFNFFGNGGEVNE